MHFVHDKRVSDCNGYFESEEGEGPVLYVATGKPEAEWIPVFLHEYSHFCQWNEGGKKWPKGWLLKDDSDPLSHLEEWFEDPKRLTAEEAHALALMCYECEADCERRTLELIKKFNFPIDRQSYAKRANAYLTFWHLVSKFGRWYETAPYESTDVLKRMSGELGSSADHAKWAGQQEEIFRKHCFPPAPLVPVRVKVARWWKRLFWRKPQILV